MIQCCKSLILIFIFGSNFCLIGSERTAFLKCHYDGCSHKTAEILDHVKHLRTHGKKNICKDPSLRKKVLRKNYKKNQTPSIGPVELQPQSTKEKILRRLMRLSFEKRQDLFQKYKESLGQAFFLGLKMAHFFAWKIPKFFVWDTPKYIMWDTPKHLIKEASSYAHYLYAMVFNYFTKREKLT